MCRYNETEDEVLIQRLRAGESMIADYLMEKYKGLVRKKGKGHVSYWRGYRRSDPGGYDRAV